MFIHEKLIGRYEYSTGESWFEIARFTRGNKFKGIFCHEGHKLKVQGHWVSDMSQRNAGVVWHTVDVKAVIYSGGFTNLDDDVTALVGSVVVAPVQDQQTSLIGYEWGSIWGRASENC
jgi:hypothetical protein